MALRVNCALDLDVDIDVYRKNITTGEYELYAGVGTVGFHLSATPAGVAISGPLSGTASERSAKPGRVHCELDVTVLQSDLLPTYEGKKVWLVLTKSGEIVGLSFLGVVTRT